MKLPPASHILTRPFYLFCSLATVVTFLLPAGVPGVTLCGFYNVLGMPCFGCGMTRALIHLRHFHFQEAWAYHPFALLLWPLMLFFGVVGLRRRWSQTLHRSLWEHEPLTSRLFWSALGLFIAFGIWRMFFWPTWIGYDTPQLGS